MFKGSIGVLNSSENKIEATEHVCICMYVCMYVCMHACMDGWMDVCMCMYVCNVM